MRKDEGREEREPDEPLQFPVSVVEWADCENEGTIVSLAKKDGGTRGVVVWEKGEERLRNRPCRVLSQREMQWKWKAC